VRNWIKQLEREAWGEVESFKFLDGSRYHYDPQNLHGWPP
jgi:hypothetical protein